MLPAELDCCWLAIQMGVWALPRKRWLEVDVTSQQENRIIKNKKHTPEFVAST